MKWIADAAASRSARDLSMFVPVEFGRVAGSAALVIIGARLIDPVDFETVVLISTAITLLAPLANAGLPLVAMQAEYELAQVTGFSSNGVARAGRRVATFASPLLGLVGGSIVAWVGLEADSSLQHVLALIFILAIGIFSRGTAELGLTLMRARSDVGYVRWGGILNMGAPLAALAAAAALGASWVPVICALVITTFLGSLGAFSRVISRSTVGDPPPQLRSLVRWGFPAAVTSVAGGSLQLLDRYVVGGILPSVQLVEYTLGYAVGSIPMMALRAASLAWGPAVLRASESRRWKLLTISSRSALLAGALMVAGVVALAPWVAQLIAPPTASATRVATVASIVSLTVLPAAYGAGRTFALESLGLQSSVAIVMLSTLGATMGLSVALTYYAGLEGAAVASVCGFVVNMLGQEAVLQRRLGGAMPGRSDALLVAIGALIGILIIY